MLAKPYLRSIHMNARSRILSTLLVLFLVLGVSSCRSGKHSRGPKEYIEKHGLNDQRKPHELAAEFKPKAKKEKRAYRKQLRKAWKKKNPGLPRRENPYRGRAK